MWLLHLLSLYIGPFCYTYHLSSISLLLHKLCANCIVHCDWLNTRHVLIDSFTHSITCVSFDIHVLGTIHSTKIPGLRFENFFWANGSWQVWKVSFHSILILVLELNDKFDFINDIVRTAWCVEILPRLFWGDPDIDMCRFSSKIFKHYVWITKRLYETLSGNSPFLTSR